MDAFVNKLPFALRGPAYMVIGCVAFATMWGLIRWASATSHPFLIVFYRNFFGTLIILPALLQEGRSLLKTDRFSFHVRRATSGILATFSAFYAVANAPLATTMAISYTTPLFATIAAVLLLGEKIRARRAFALIVGFAGMLVVVRPGHIPLSWGIIAAIIAALSSAASIIAVKELTRTENPRAVVIYQFLLMLPPSLVLALPFWRWPSWQELPVLFAIAVCAAIGQTTTVRAFRVAEATAVLPYDFVRFGVVILIGWLGFNESVDAYTLLGGIVILAATIYLARRETIVSQSVRPASQSRQV